MKRLEKLTKLNSFLRTLSLADKPEVAFNYVTTESDATSLLDKSAGIQVLIARPELRQSFDDLGVPRSTDLDTAIFVLEKNLGAARTAQTECEQFDRLEEVAEDILNLVFESMYNCTYGLQVSNLDIRPEVSIFGGWNGYSIAISFR
jgi:hypothetical protein